MKIVDKRSKQFGGTTNLVPGTVIFYENKYLLITDVHHICIDLSTGKLLDPPTNEFDYHILNDVKLVVK